MGGNPFHEDRYTKLEDFYDEPRVPSEDSARDVGNFYDFVEHCPTNENAQPTFRHNGMSHSLSEGNIDFRSHAGQSKAGYSRHRRLASDEILIQYSEDDTKSFSSHSRGALSSASSRGRSVFRTPSPEKLEGIKEANRSIEELSMFPQRRRHSPVKQLFGEHGWLGGSMSTKDLPGDVRRKKIGLKGWTGKLKERVEQIVSAPAWFTRRKTDFEVQTPDMPKIDLTSLTSRLHSPPKSKSQSPNKTRFYVSLYPPQQARMYSEMELMIVASANEYLHTQQREGRMSVDSLTRVLENWISKNRPQVIEFQFDQTTQRELILLNLKTFRFFGPTGDDLISIHRMMQHWKALARDMGVRNFCTPDAVVRKNLVEAYKVLEMLGAPMVTVVAFCDIKERVEAVIAEKTKARREYEKIQFGVEKKWEPLTENKKEGVILNQSDIYREPQLFGFGKGD